MSRTHSALPIHALRRRRRLLAGVLLIAASLWTASSFAQCLPLLPMSSSSAMSQTTEAPSGAVVGDICCPPAVCAMTMQDGAPIDGAALPPTGIKLWSVIVFAVAALLFALSAPRTLTLPPSPLLPKRPRTLKFYALRI